MFWIAEGSCKTFVLPVKIMMIHPPRSYALGRRIYLVVVRTALASEILRYHHQRLSCHHILQTAKYVLNDYIKNFSAYLPTAWVMMRKEALLS